MPKIFQEVSGYEVEASNLAHFIKEKYGKRPEIEASLQMGHDDTCEIFADGGDGTVLIPINDGKQHQALRWTVQGISSTSPKQAFVIAWNIRFETPDGKHVTVNVPRAMTSWDSQPRTYTFPLTDDWKGIAASGMLGGNSIEDFVSEEYKAYYRKIIEDPNGCDITANAEIQKYLKEIPL